MGGNRRSPPEESSGALRERCPDSERVGTSVERVSLSAPGRRLQTSLRKHDLLRDSRGKTGRTRLGLRPHPLLRSDAALVPPQSGGTGQAQFPDPFGSVLAGTESASD